MRALLMIALVSLAVPSFAEEPPEKEKVEPQMVLPLKGVYKSNAQKIADKLQALDAIESAEVDAGEKAAKLVYSPGKELTLMRLSQAVKSVRGATIDTGRLTFKDNLDVIAGGQMEGAQGRKRGHRRRDSGQLLRAAKGQEGIAAVRWNSESVLAVTVKGEVSYKLLARLFAEHGSNDDGSNRIADIRWTTKAAKPDRSAEREEKKKRRKKK